MIIPSFANPEEFKLLAEVSCLTTTHIINSKIRAIQLEIEHRQNTKEKKAGISTTKHIDFLKQQILDLEAAKTAIQDIILQK